MELAKKLQQLRHAEHCSQEQLAEKLNVSRQTISNWKTGRNLPDIYSLVLIGDLYNLSLDELMKDDEEEIKQVYLVKRAYLVTEMDRLDYGGSALIHAHFNHKYLRKLIEDLNTHYPAYTWKFGTMDQLSREVSPEDTQVLLALSRNSLPYKHALASQYPRALIKDANELLHEPLFYNKSHRVYSF